MLFNLLLLIVYKTIKVTNIYYVVSGIERYMPQKSEFLWILTIMNFNSKISSPIEWYFAISTLYLSGLYSLISQEF